MNQQEQYQLWASYAVISRAWVQFMDMKAGFITALNLGVLATLWGGDALFGEETKLCVKALGCIATILSMASIVSALVAVIPRESLGAIFGRNTDWTPDYMPISYYGYVSRKWSMQKFGEFRKEAEKLNWDETAHEALEQHFVISHTVAAKSSKINISAYFLMAAFIAVAATLITRLFQ